MGVERVRGSSTVHYSKFLSSEEWEKVRMLLVALFNVNSNVVAPGMLV